MAATTDPNCIFCKIVAGKQACERIYEDESVLAFLDIFPISQGHTLVIPKAHFVDVQSTPSKTWTQVQIAVQKLLPAVISAATSDGANIGVNVGKAAGQAVFHVHAHIIPRWHDDGLKNWKNLTATPDELAKTRKAIVGALAAQHS